MKKFYLFFIVFFAFTTILLSQNYPEMITVKGGTFVMGDEWGVGEADELPTHSIMIKGFKIAKTETTVAQYREFCIATGKSMPETPNWGWQSDAPIVNIDWHDAESYCDWLSDKTGILYRLPTEAEWEYAARGGNKSQGFKYSGGQTADVVAIFESNSNNKTNSVAIKRANELGIYDMSGNVWEWCSDWYDKNYYFKSPRANPKGPEKGTYRVLRGGSFHNSATICRVAIRLLDSPTAKFSDYGFRVVSSFKPRIKKN